MALKTVFEAEPTAEVVVQERVLVTQSGVAASTPEFLYIEYIDGALSALLRDGVTPSRLMLDARRGVVIEQRNRMEFSYNWHGTSLRQGPPTIPRALPEEALAEICTAAERLTPGVAFEWLRDDMGRISIIDLKTLPTAFLADAATLLLGIQHNTLLTAAEPLCGRLSQDPAAEDADIFVLEHPLYAYMPAIDARFRAILCAHGGVLSHLLLYAAQEHILCVVSPRWYELLATERKITQITPSAMLASNFSHVS